MAQVANWPVPPPGANAVGVAGAAEGTIFTAATYAAGTVNSPEIQNSAAKGVRLFINITNIGAGSVIVSIQTKDLISGTWISAGDGFTTGTIVTAIPYLLTVYPGIAETPGTATVSAETSDHLGTPFRVVLVTTGNPVLSVSGIFLA